MSNTLKTVADDDRIWRNVLFNTYPSCQKYITRNFRWVFIKVTKYNADQRLEHSLKQSCFTHKIVIGGAGGVGCTAIIKHFVENIFPIEYDPTIEDAYRKHIMLDGFKTELDLLDTAGQEEYRALRDQYMRYYTGFIVVYAVCSRSSFDDVTEWVEQVRRVKDTKDVPIIIAANKIDLAREVTRQEGEQLAADLGVDYFELTATNRDACEELYYRAARLTRDSASEVRELWESLERGIVPKKIQSKKKCFVM